MFCLLLFFSVEVYEAFTPLPAQKWNITNLKEISVADLDNFTCAVFGDNRDSKDVFETILRKIDHDTGIDFAVSLGETVQKGEKERYRWFLQQVRTNLGIPLLIAMGHHEHRGDGPELYRAVFGPLHYTFKVGNNLFIFLDDRNGKGIDPSQKAWFLKELEKCGNQCTPIVFLNAPLYDPIKGRQHECLPRKSSEELIKLFSLRGVKHIFASHTQGYLEGQWGGIPFTITGGAGAPLKGNDPEHDFFHFLKVHVRNGQVDVKVENLPPPINRRIGRFAYGAWICISSFFRFYGMQTLLLLMAAGLVIGIHRRGSLKG